MTTDKAEQIINDFTKEEIDTYIKYWESITPKDDEAIGNRWLFSFLSVHTSWSMNVSSYLLLTKHRDMWINDRQELSRLLIDSKVGLFKIREEGIWNYFQDKVVNKTSEETWSDYRDKVMDTLRGLGPAKTAFALEMCFPLENKSVCLDTHMLNLYGYGPRDQYRAKKDYKCIEQHWVDTCDKVGIPPTIARCLFWDKRQMQNSSRYWTYIFE